MVQNALRPLSKEDKEANHPYRVGAVLDLPKLEDIPQYYNPGVPESWIFNQVEFDPNNDECAGASSALVSGMQEGTELDPHFHWMMARQRAGMKIPDFGVNNRDLAMTLVKVGSLKKEDSPYTFATPRDTIADPASWQIEKLLPKAILQKKGSVVWVKPHNAYDAFDVFRASITKFNKLYQKTHGAVFGLVYSQPSNDPNIKEVTEQGAGHDVALIGWNGDNAIMVNSLGINAGTRGMFTIHRKVINRWAEEFGMFILIDATQEDIDLASKSPLKLDDITSTNILRQLYVKAIALCTQLVEMLKKASPLGRIPPALSIEDAIIQVESGGNNWAIGDRDLEFSAYGPMQIRWPCVKDVNDRYRTDYRARQCLGNRELSKEIFRKYCDMYLTKERLGREVTNEDRARLWNGGNGAVIWRPHPRAEIERQLQAYWRKVKEYL